MKPHLKTKKTLTSLTLALSLWLCFSLSAPSSFAQGQQAPVQDESAKQAEAAADSSEITGIAYSVTAAICTWACVAAFGDTLPWAGYAKVACNISNIGSAVYDAVENQNVAGLLAPAMTILMPAIADGGSIMDPFTATTTQTVEVELQGPPGPDGQGPGTAKVEQTQQDGSKLTCFTALLAGATAFAKFESAKAMRESASESNNISSSYRNNGNSTPRVDLQNGRQNGGAGLELAAGVTTADSNSRPNAARECKNQALQGAAAAFFNCARAQNPSEVSGGFLDPNFRDNFETITGNNLDDLVGALARGGGSSGAKIAAAAGPNYPKSAELASAFDEIGSLFASNPAASEVINGGYRGGGGSGGGSSKKKGDAPLDINKAFDQILAGMQPGKEKKKDPKNLLAFKGKNVDPEAIWANRDISLFDRVSYRYQENREKVLEMRWSTGFNRAMATDGSTK